MTKSLTIAPGMSLPLDAVTQTLAVIARRGAGKTHTAVVLAEEMLSAHLQVVVLDPLGVWWGLRSSFDGKSKGFPVVVFGGDHGDVPLTEHMGAHVADVIVSRTISAVIDLSTLSKSAARRFGTAFAERLYEAKQPQEKHTPLHLFVDEADLFIPQRVQPDQARMLSAFEMFPRRGRNRGFGVTVITQRPATINKDVLTQAEVLITLQITGVQDRKAVLEWVEGHDDGNHRDEFLKSLAGLQRGQAWVWSPAWLDVFKLVQIRQRQTYNSSATPTIGQVIKAPKELAPIDLERLREDMAEVVQEAEKNDPVVLKKRIKELEGFVRAANQELDKRKNAPAEIHPAQEATIIALRDQEWTAAIQERRSDVAKLLESLGKVNHSMIVPASRPRRSAAAKVLAAAAHESVVPHWRAPTPAAPLDTGRVIMSHTASTDGQKLVRGERLILTALAQVEGKPRSAAYVGAAAELSSSSGTFGTYLSSLRSQGLIEGSGDALRITEKGVMALGPYEPLPTGEALVERWCNRLGGGAARILRAAAAAYPQGLSAEEIGQQANISPTSGTFGTYLSKLRTLRLIEGRGEIKATAELMGDA